MSKTISIVRETPKISNKYKDCPCCGQGLIPFKNGVCFCGTQVGSIQYVKDPKKFAERHYSFLGDNSCNY